MSAKRTCHYCGWSPAKVRRPGEPATCYQHRDLPRRERDAELELERLLERHYAGDE